VYKLTLLKEAEKLTAQFFFPHILGSDACLLEALVRFSVLFVHNSIRLQRPTPFKSERSICDQIEFLFENVIRDRFVEESLLFQNKHCGVLQDADTTLLNFSDCMDGLSLIDSVVAPPVNSVSVDIFDDSLLDSDAWGGARKRPRALGGDEHVPFDVPLPSALSGCDDKLHFESRCSIQACSLDPLFRRELENDTILTASQLSRILKKLSMTVGNQKSTRLQSLKRYFDARNTELMDIFKGRCNDGKEMEQKCILGIEVVLEGQTTSNDIIMYLQGGKKVSRLRNSVDIPKRESLVLEDISNEELGDICTKLGIPVGLSHFDVYMNGVWSSRVGGKCGDGPSCCFVLVQDIVSKS
jgi:hypothetical protein